VGYFAGEWGAIHVDIEHGKKDANASDTFIKKLVLIDFIDRRDDPIGRRNGDIFPLWRHTLGVTEKVESE
jgi:hypothetical protein